MESLPRSWDCPKCKSTTFRSVRPEHLVAFRNDRICRQCNTRYAPPMPRWAGALFMVSGVVCIAACIAGVVAMVVSIVSGEFDLGEAWERGGIRGILVGVMLPFVLIAGIGVGIKFVIYGAKATFWNGSV